MSIKSLVNLMGNRLHTLPLVVLYLTDGCNSRCVMCDIWKNPRRNMSLELVEKITQAVDDLQIKWVLLSGGEAMQHPEWATIAQSFRETGVYVMLLTNGLLVQKQAEKVAATVDELIVSLDAGDAPTYNAIRGVDAFDLVLSGIEAVRAKGVPVTTRTTVQKENFRQIPQIIDACLSIDVNQISFLAVDISNPFAFGNRFQSDRSIPLMGVTNHENYENPSALTRAETEELAHILNQVEIDYADEFTSGRLSESPQKLRRILLQYFQTLNTQNAFPAPPCNAPHFSTVIEVDGTLRPCYFLPSYGKFSPNKESLAEVINTDVAQALRKAYRSGKRQECQRCVCPLYKSPGTLLRM